MLIISAIKPWLFTWLTTLPLEPQHSIWQWLDCAVSGLMLTKTRCAPLAASVIKTCTQEQESQGHSVSFLLREGESSLTSHNRDNQEVKPQSEARAGVL